MSNATNGTGSTLAVRFPVDKTMELTLHNGTIARGTVYCTDETSQTVVLLNSLTHTTLAHEIRVVHTSSVKSEKLIEGSSEVTPALPQPLPKVQKKVLEERERKALRLAEEGFRQINQQATPQGQLVFDRLLKACNDVTWKGESILVLNEVQVDPPYGPDNCFATGSKKAEGSLAGASLDRIKKIVGAP